MALPPAKFPAAGELLQRQVTARAAPRTTARAVAVVREFDSKFRKHVVLAHEVREDVRVRGRLWYRISLVGRPNGRTGWIRAESARLRPTRAEVIVRRNARALELRVNGRLRLRTRVAIGKPGAETPLGLYYVTWRFKPDKAFFGDFALELSAYSRLTDWPGGGVVGIHGTNRPDLLGRAVSHGCIRVSNAAARSLQRLAPAGTPVRILR